MQKYWEIDIYAYCVRHNMNSMSRYVLDYYGSNLRIFQSHTYRSISLNQDQTYAASINEAACDVFHRDMERIYINIDRLHIHRYLFDVSCTLSGNAEAIIREHILMAAIYTHESITYRYKCTHSTYTNMQSYNNGIAYIDVFEDNYY